jgi:antitoxin FitA
MATLTIRGLSSETYRALEMRAAHHGRSTEAEIRAIPEEAVRPQERVKVGSVLATFGRRFGGLDLSVARDGAPMAPAISGGRTKDRMSVFKRI